MSTIKLLPLEAEPFRISDRGPIGHQWVYRFDNGYGVSILHGCGNSDSGDRTFQCSVVRFAGDCDWNLDYTTSAASDILSWQSIDQVAALLIKVASLPPKPGARASEGQPPGA